MSDDEGDEVTFGLVMPFVAVTSNGGPYEDEAYCAGYEVGSIDARLEHEYPASLSLPVRGANLEQIDLVAMRRGYTVEIVEPEPGGWASITLEKAAESPS